MCQQRSLPNLEVITCLFGRHDAASYVISLPMYLCTYIPSELQHMQVTYCLAAPHSAARSHGRLEPNTGEAHPSSFSSPLIGWSEPGHTPKNTWYGRFSRQSHQSGHETAQHGHVTHVPHVPPPETRRAARWRAACHTGKLGHASLGRDVGRGFGRWSGMYTGRGQAKAQTRFERFPITT